MVGSVGSFWRQAACGVGCGIAFALLPSAWADGLQAAPPSLRAALTILESTSVGARLLARARTERGDPTLGWIYLGSVSRTDAVLTRYYDAASGRERREQQVSVTLKADQTPLALVLDLAHELTHALDRPALDPYDPELSPLAYVRSAIEGAGGEVAALLLECQLGAALAKRYPQAHERCQIYYDDWGRLSRARVVEDFYRVGSWLGQLQPMLAASPRALPLLSAEAPALISSTGGAPYPVALFAEYRSMTQAACDNSRRRSLQLGRSPASARAAQEERFLLRRCSG